MVDGINKGLETNDKVVCTFAVMGLFKGEKEFFKKLFPQIKFIKVKVDFDILKKRFWERNKIMQAQSGLSDQDFWNSDEMADARQEFGDEFSHEKLEKFLDRSLYNPKLIDIEADQPDCHVITNNDWETNQAIKELNEIAGLDWVEPDTKAIAEVNYKRYANVKNLRTQD